MVIFSGLYFILQLNVNFVESPILITIPLLKRPVSIEFVLTPLFPYLQVLWGEDHHLIIAEAVLVS